MTGQNLNVKKYYDGTTAKRQKNIITGYQINVKKYYDGITSKRLKYYNGIISLFFYFYFFHL